MTTSPPIASTRLAGTLYVVIIVCGVAAGVLRGPFAGADDAALADAIANGAPALRASALLDVLMALADVGVGVALFTAFASVARALSTAALAFRLAQAAAIAINLVPLLVAVELGVGGNVLAGTFLRAHATGYDLSLFFFAINCVLMGCVVARAGVGPRGLGPLLGLTGVVYLVGSTLRVVSPPSADVFAAAYVVPLLVEIAFAITLLRYTGPGQRADVVDDAGALGSLQPRLA